MEDRNSGLNDANTVQKSRVHRLSAEERLTDFTNLDSSLDASWIADWKIANDAAEETGPDELYMDIMQQRTEDVKDKTEKCLKALRDLRYYAGLAFGKRARYKSFGFNRMTRVAQSTPAFLVFIKVNHRLAVTVQAQLLANGMTVTQIDNINTTATALAEAELLQELHKRNRLTETEARIDAINKIWEFMSRASRAAEVIYSNNEVVRAMFYLPERSKKAKKKTEEQPV